MIATNDTTAQDNFTELELEVIKAIKNQDNPAYFFLGEIFYRSSVDSKQLKGAASSLIKKGVIYVDKTANNLMSVMRKDLFDPRLFD